jgi:3-hydroxyacyl-CoA dehydrogenase
VLATNTSYLDPNRDQRRRKPPRTFPRPAFFQPAAYHEAAGDRADGATSPEVLATGFALARLLGKIPVRAGICDGFIGNRILKVTRAQAERLLLSGATPSAVDAAMRAFGLPMGPFEAQDLGGLDIAAFQRKAARERGVTYAFCARGGAALRALSALARNRRWLVRLPAGRPRSRSRRKPWLRSSPRRQPVSVQRVWDDASIADAIILPMVNEAMRILEERVALRSADIDLVKIHGYGFPRWRGGPMHYAVARGLGEVVAVLDRLSAEGLAEPPSNGLRRAATQSAI